MRALKPTTFEHQKYSILIIDDNPTNLSVIVDYLSHCGFEIMVARHGKMGIKRAKYALPDLILLDVKMPQIDGFETCRRLKADAKTKDIPVIFMTALTSTQDKVRGFAVGAVDYVTKPIQHEEVLARITTHLTIRKLQKKLQKANHGLEEANTLLEQR
ncbi:MAG: response regulator, partial [Ardenticatenaceae bacterium]